LAFVWSAWLATDSVRRSCWDRITLYALSEGSSAEVHRFERTARVDLVGLSQGEWGCPLGHPSALAVQYRFQ